MTSESSPVDAFDSITNKVGSRGLWSPADLQQPTKGAQFTCEAFTQVLSAHDIRINMDGKGRWVDNVFVERLWRSLKV